MINADSPRVSVIIPAYNRYSLLIEAIESVRAQTFTDYELLIVDDGSTDETPALANELDIHYMSPTRTGMPGASRNRGAEAARGEYLGFLDSDDLWLPEKLEKQVAVLDSHAEIPLVHTRELWKRGEKTVSQKGQNHRREGDVFRDALWKCTIGPSTVLMRKGVFMELGGFDETLEVAEDYEFWLRLTSRYPVFYIDEALTVKRAGGWDQLSEKYGQIEEFRIEALFRLLENRRLSESRQLEALAMLKQKIDVWQTGARKRGRDAVVDDYLNRLGRISRLY